MSYLKYLQKPFIKLLLLFLFTRILLTFTGTYFRNFYKDVGVSNIVQYSNIEVLNSWGYWDTIWYLDIVNNGYTFEVLSKSGWEGQSSYNFFPLYPLSVKLVSFVLTDPLLSGILTSNVSFVISLYLLYSIVKESHNEKLALRSVRYMILFPTSYIFSAMLSESLFLLFLLASYRCLQKKNWPLFGLSGLGIALTRVNGIAILLPLFVEYFYHKKYQIKNIKLKEIVWFLFIPIGFLAFGVFVWIHTNNSLAFITIREAWGSHLTNPIVYIVKLLLKWKGAYGVYVATSIVSLTALIVLVSQKIPLRWTVLVLTLFLLPLMFAAEPGLLVAVHRLVLPAFPIYFGLAKLTTNEKADIIVCGIFFVGLVVLQSFAAAGFSLII